MKQVSATRRGRAVLLSALVMLPLAAGPHVYAQSKEAAPSPAVRSPAEAATPTLYHLLYTLSESDGGKQLGTQHFVLTVSPDQDRPAELKVGSKVPVVSSPHDSNIATQVTYVDVGLTIQARPQKAVAGGLLVFSSVQQSSVAASPDEKVYQPVIRNTELQDVAVLYPDKPVSLGSFDVPGSTRHYEVQVVLQPVR